MSFIRPELRAALFRWREVIAAAAVAGVGVWLLLRGGWLLGALGAVAVVAGVGLARVAWQRLRFASDPVDPGVIDVLEGQISYLGPHGGGWIALSELEELMLVRADGTRFWRLRQADGRSLDLPVAAVGAEKLFDVFAALPGLGPDRLLRALEGSGPAEQSLWLMRRGPALTRLARADRSSP